MSLYLKKTLNVGMFFVQDWTEEKFKELSVCPIR